MNKYGVSLFILCEIVCKYQHKVQQELEPCISSRILCTVNTIQQTPCPVFFCFFLFFLSLISLLTVSKTNKHQPAIGLQL